MTEVSPKRNPRLVAWRIVMGGALVAWFVKLHLQTAVFFQGAEHAILHHTLLPEWFCSPRVGAVLYFLPLLSVLGLFTQRILWLRLSALLYTCCTLLMLWHVQSYNDATHVTAFWTGLWLLWWAGRVATQDAASLWHGLSLAVAVLSLCWLGGGAGKLTSEYWAGEPFYYLYFMDKPQFPFSHLRDNLTEETLRSIAMIFSRMVVVTELVLATSFLWPARFAAAASLCVLTLMVIISQLQLFSVLGPLMALSIAITWLVEKDPASKPIPSL